jgi:membrane associated rhomboid family serine protease
MPRSAPRIANALRSTAGRPVVTYALIALCIIVYVVQLLPNSPATNALLYYPPFTYTEPWRMITSLFVHSPGSLLHIGFNMISLFIVGPILERLLGRARFLALYLVSGFGGSVGVLLLAPTTPVLGASGAIFGLLGAFFVLQRGLGGNSVQILVLIGINLVIGFLPGTNIAWQAHVGGLITGAAVAFVYLRTRRTTQRRTQVLLVAAVFAALVAITVLRLYLP